MAGLADAGNAVDMVLAGLDHVGGGEVLEDCSGMGGNPERIAELDVVLGRYDSHSLFVVEVGGTIAPTS